PPPPRYNFIIEGEIQMSFVHRSAACDRHHGLLPLSAQVVLFCAFVCADGVAHGAPVTFAFDATVTDIADPGNLAGQLPFEPSVGQAISGLVTFTPVPFAQMSADDAMLRISLGGQSFSASNLKLTTENDVFIIVGFSVEGPFDSLSVSCGINTQCPTSSSSIAAVDVRYLGIGFGGGDVIPSNAIVDSPYLWNLFPNRRLVLTLSGINEGMPLTISANVGPMRLIPEPASTMIFATALGWLSMVRGLLRQRRHRPSQKHLCCGERHHAMV
ncbi:MAG: hypothetical protein WD229_13045, partial [Pirellulales bacterium]